MFFKKIRTGVLWRYELYFSEYLDLFGSASYFLQYLVNFYRLRNAKVVYVYANKRNIGDYISHLGVKHIVGENGGAIVCSPVGKYWYEKQIQFLQKHNPNCHLIIGGGGLFQGIFEDFWQLLINSHLDFSVVGVGVNLLEGRHELSKDLLVKIIQKSKTLAVRDELTLNYLSSQSPSQRVIHLHCCPSLNYLNSLSLIKTKTSKYLLHMLHPSDIRLAGIDIDELRCKVKEVAANRGLNYVEYTNMDKEHLKGVQLVYSATCVVTTRLHGAIMSFAFGVPVACIVCDIKMVGFLSTHLKCEGLNVEDVNSKHSVDLIEAALTRSFVAPDKVSSNELLRNQEIGHKIKQHLLSCENEIETYYVNH